MSISHEAFRRAQESELANWAKDAANATRVLHELVEHSSVAVPLRHVANGMHFERALDVGCGCFGFGFLAVHMADCVRSIDGVDPLPRIDLAIKDDALATYVESLRNRVRYHQCAGEELPFESGTYDLVACINVVDHARDPDRILVEIGRVLKPEGLFVFGVSTLSLLGEWKWRLNRWRRPNEWLFVAHPHTYQWHRADALVRRIGGDVLWCDKPSWRKRIAGHGRMSFWILRKT